ncbi:hypothetical protein [Streptomyces mexicanus]|uniref:hypothetical protein n=1 Tax=Streptomyces mexicanus TaxID=178566 RepID=UPI0031EF5C79
MTVTTGSDPAPTHVASSPTVPVGQQAVPRDRISNGVPVGYPRTEAGAKAAAANYVIVSGTSAFLTDKRLRHQAVAVMAARGSAPTLVSDADQAAERASSDLRGDNAKLDPRQAVARTGVLAERVLGFDIHKATIRLWTTTVRGNSAGHTTPTAAFHSVTVGLVWEHDDWKLSSSSAGHGLVAPIDYRQATNPAGDFADYVPGKAEDAVLTGSTDADGFPAPYERTDRGARAAATSAVMLWGDPRFFSDTTWRHRMLAATAAPDAIDTLTSDTDATARLVSENRGVGEDGRTLDGGLLVTRTAVLATRTLADSDRTASIELWTASVGGVAGQDETQRPQIAFLRMTVDLAWTGGTWKATAVTPSEPLVPAPPAAEEAAPAGSFADVGGAADAPATA